MSDDVQKTMIAVAHLVSTIDGKIDAGGKTTPNQASPGSAKGSMGSASVDSGIPEEPQPSDQQDTNATSRRTSSITVSGVLLQLEQLIVSDEWTRKEQDNVVVSNAHGGVKRRRTDGPRLNELGRSLVTSYSLKAYIDLLGVNHRQSIASWLYGNTSSAVASLFRFPNALLHCEDSDSAAVHSVRSGIGHAARLALRHVYGADYATRGWSSFVDHGAPVVYVSPALHLDIGAYLTSEFGIAETVVIDKFDTSTLADVEGRLNHVDFEKRLDADMAAGKRPLLVIAVVGSTIFGQNDMVSRLIELRKQRGFWLHIVGMGIALLALRDPTETFIKVLSQVDSLSFPLAQWLGIPAAPVVTLHRPVENYKPTYREKLDTLPWWVATQHLTLKRMTDTLEAAFLLSKMMIKGLSNFDRIEIFGVDNATDTANRIYKGQTVPLTAIVFKYRYFDMPLPKSSRRDSVSSLSIVDRSAPNSPVAGVDVVTNIDQLNGGISAEDIEYADSLNSWLGQGLISECRALGLHLIELGGVFGTSFRFCPLESASASGTRPEHVHQFIKQLSDTLSIVNATVTARRRLPDILVNHPTLCRLPILKWAGVGAVCYIPSIVRETSPIDWNDKQKEQVSHLNIELVHSLRATDSAFSSGDSSIGVSCVKFGMLADEKDLDDLIHMVAERGKTIEESAQYMESLAEMIREGIEAANIDLKRESDERLMQEGVIRQLPIMGSLVNWLSPLGKETTNIKGRSFDLKTGTVLSGRILSTDVLYKYRLKLDDGTHEPTSPTIETPPQIPHSSTVLSDVGDRESDETTNTKQNGVVIASV